MPATAITPSSCWRRPYFHTIGGGLLPPAWSSHPHSHSAAKREKDEVFSLPAPSIPLPPLQVPRGPQRLPLPPPHVKQHAPPLPALSPSAAPDLCPSHGSLCDTGAPSRLLSHRRAPHPRLPRRTSCRFRTPPWLLAKDLSPPPARRRFMSPARLASAADARRCGAGRCQDGVAAIDGSQVWPKSPTT